MKIRINSIEFDEPLIITVQLSQSDRIKRALKSFVLFLMAAVASIFIPVLHFFLVPLFLIISVIYSFIQYHQTSCVDLTGFSCPNCKAALTEKKAYFKEDNLKTYCYNCRSTLYLV